MTKTFPHFSNVKFLNIQQISVVWPPDPNIIHTLVLQFRSLLALLLIIATAMKVATKKEIKASKIINNILKYYQDCNKRNLITKILTSMYIDENQSVISRIDKMMQSKQSQEINSDKQYIQSLPPQFIQFLKEKQIPVEQLTVPIPRYIRLKPNANINQLQLIKSLKITSQDIVKIDQQFYALHPGIKINQCPLYEKGYIYGMDYSSCVPARCLNVEENDKVLELCSAPGNKSMYLADSVENISITGVEISINRANVMKNLIKKYNLTQKIQVKVEDGLKYDSEILYDRVLIDAECTHQGSIKHIKKFIPNSNSNQNKKNEIKKLKNLTKQQIKQFQLNNSNPYTTQIKKNNEWSVQDFKQRFLDEKKLNNLTHLQSGLLQNGFRLLKEDGILVYSTCSFDTSQNQDIIQAFLTKNKNAILQDCTQGLKSALNFERGRLKQTIRFLPSVSRCGGMFVSKIKKTKGLIIDK